MADYITIEWEDHDFEKTNLVTDSGGYDWYKCKKCGLVAWRHGLGPIKTWMSSNPTPCQKRVESGEIKKVKIIDHYPDSEFGLKYGEVYETCKCPESESHKYGNAVWVFSPKRNEPVRLLSREYTFV